MVPRPSTLLILLSALNSYYVSGAIVTLLVPAASPDVALSGKYLGTDSQGHTSWSVGPGSPSGSFTDTDFPGVTIVAGATDALARGTLATVLGGISATISAMEGCTFATPANSAGAVSATCLASGQVVGNFGPGGVPTTSFTQTEFVTLETLVPIQVPDSGTGAIPSSTSSSTSSSPTSTSTSTSNGASKGSVSWGIAGPVGFFILIASLM